MTNIVAKW